MELPLHLKNLYRHWDNHTVPQVNSVPHTELFNDTKLYKEIVFFINERMMIWEKKSNGQKIPFTKDQILSTYRFCNIFRELDKQTILFHTLLNPLRDNFPLWLLNMFYCRMVARPETIEAVGLLSYNTNENESLYTRLLHSPRPRFGTPYVFPVSVILKSKTPTRELFITHYLPTIMNVISNEIVTWKKESVYVGVEKILLLFGYNLRFLWTEVLIDVAYQFPNYIDLFKQFPIGPGSLPTMHRISPAEDPSILVTKLTAIKVKSNLTYNNKTILLSAENWEGVGCEFRKYTNLKQGRGRKRIFNTF